VSQGDRSILALVRQNIVQVIGVYAQTVKQFIIRVKHQKSLTVVCCM